MRPSLDHYVGRPFETLIYGDDQEDWNWAIQLEGGVQIKNKDVNRTQPPMNLDGSALMVISMGELDTILKFGTPDTTQEEVTLTPTLYTISDPDNPSEEEIYPQVPVEAQLPPDPSPEREATGPTGPETPVEAPQEAPEADSGDTEE